MNRTYYVTDLEVRVLSARPLDEQTWSNLEALASETDTGDCVGTVSLREQRPVSRKEIQRLLAEAGSDSTFFEDE